MTKCVADEIVRLYQNGSSKGAISYLLGISPRKVALTLAKAGVPTRNTRIKQQQLYDQMQYLLSLGLKQKEVARRVGMTRGSVRYAQLQNFKVKPKRSCETLRPTIVDLLKNGMTFDQIAKHLKISSTTARKYVAIERELNNA